MNELIKKQTLKKQIQQHEKAVKDRKTKSIKHKPTIKKPENE